MMIWSLRNDEIVKTDQVSDDDMLVIPSLSRDERIGEWIIHHPFLHQFSVRKLSREFRGVSRNQQEKHEVRADINVLLCGDPGTDESQFLKYVPGLCPPKGREPLMLVGLFVFWEASPPSELVTLDLVVEHADQIFHAVLEATSLVKPSNRSELVELEAVWDGVAKMFSEATTRET